MSDEMTSDQFQQLMSRIEGMDRRFDNIDARLDHVEKNMVRKSDVFQSVLTVQGFTIAIIIGVVVVLNATIGFGGGTG